MSSFKQIKMSRKKIQEKGVSLYIAIVVLAILLGISLGLSALIAGKIKIIRGIEESVIAFYAADTGIELTLKDRADPKSSSGSIDLGGGNSAQYEVTVSSPGESGCPSEVFNFCIRSIGTYKNTRRAVEVRY